MKLRTILPLATLAGIVVLGWWLAVREYGASPSAEAHIPDPLIIEPAPIQAPTLSGERSAMDQSTKCVKDLLEAHWGMSIDELKREYPEGSLTDELLKQGSVLTPWESVEPVVRARFTTEDEVSREQRLAKWLRWEGGAPSPDYGNLTYNPKGKTLAAIDKQNLNRLVAEYDSQLRTTAGGVETALEESLADAFDNDRYKRSPLVRTYVPTNDKQRQGLFHVGKYTNEGGWVVDFEFDSADYPSLEQELRAVEELRVKRLAAVRDYINGLP